MGWPSVSFEPVRIHTINSSSTDILIIGVDGQLAWVDGNTLEQKTQPKAPFPARIILSSITEKTVVACWLNRDLLISRMASIDLSQEFQEGLSQQKLRNFATAGNGDVHVKGANWSHILDAECLAIDVDDIGIIFSLWNRGIYRIRHDTSELWRKPEIKWTEMGTIEEAKIPAKIVIIGEEVHIWSRAGERAILDKETGDLIDFKVAKLDISVDRIFCKTISSKNEIHWLVVSDENTAYWIKEIEGEENIVSAGLRGPINDAKFDTGSNSWRITGWREDIMWDSQEIIYEDTKEVGVSLYCLSGKWMVLNNRGDWGPFTIGKKSRTHSSSEEE